MRLKDDQQKGFVVKNSDFYTTVGQKKGTKMLLRL